VGGAPGSSVNAAAGDPFTSPSQPGRSAHGSRSGGSESGISFTPPPPIELTSPVSGIAFGRAPFLWPLFAALDALLCAGIVVVVRRVRSARGGR
jgi:hypothetical protein